MAQEAQTNHIVQTPGSISLCLGCGSCELVCGLNRDGLSGLNRGGIHLQRAEHRKLRHTVLVCEQCEEHPCYDVCSLKDEAICIDENGIVYIVEEKCKGCGLCRKACIHEPSRITIIGKGKNRKARKCDLCRTRPEGPLCIEQCPAQCLVEAKDFEAVLEASK